MGLKAISLILSPMASKIRVLDELTINKIAAGEVIENPASVVKELVENSLDAGAQDIHVEILSGGRQLIRIVDDGSGMNRDDALLCLERYATSKIRQVDDLTELGTMGFRGEALPSIASISKFTLLTATADCVEGTLVIVEGGQVLKCCGATRSPGTTIEVKSLFFNVPVRRKFQRSPAHDVSAIERTVSLLALAHPKVRFTLISDQKPLLTAPASTASGALDQLLQRTQAVLGREFTEDAIRVDSKADGFSLIGLIGSPLHHRPNRSSQYLVINHRVVVSHLVSMAVCDGYGTSLPNQRHPLFVLQMGVPGDLLDVNVHPQKREVRIRQEQQLREFIRKAIQKALSGNKVDHEPSMVFHDMPWSKPSPIVQPTVLPWDLPERPTPAPLRPMPMPMPMAPPAPSLTVRPINRRVLACLPGYFVLDPASCQGLGSGEQGLWVVDQRAAHHRILYERILSASSATAAEVQPLLLPLTLQMNSLDSALIMDALPELQRIGLDIASFGRNSFHIQAIPVDLMDIDIANFLNEIAEELRAFQSQNLVEKERGRRIALKASRSALSRRAQLSSEEARRLLEGLLCCETPYQCPQGKPTLVCLEPEALAKLFQK